MSPFKAKIIALNIKIVPKSKTIQFLELVKNHRSKTDGMMLYIMLVLEHTEFHTYTCG